MPALFIRAYYRQRCAAAGAFITTKGLLTTLGAFNLQLLPAMAADKPAQFHRVPALGAAQGTGGVRPAAKRTNPGVLGNQLFTIITWVLISDHF